MTSFVHFMERNSFGGTKYLEINNSKVDLRGPI